MLPPCLWLVNRPKAFLMAFIIALVSSGIYSINQNVMDIVLMVGMGVLGYVMRVLRFPILPLVLALVLGGIVERNFRRAVDLGYGDYSIFIKDPLSATLLGLTVLFVAITIVMNFRRRRRAATQTTVQAAE